MQQIVNIHKENVSTYTNSVNARELHEFIEAKQQFANWIKNRINKYGFVENQDYIIKIINTAGRPSKEYYITLDMAKELCMVENNEKGREARRYFIEMERKQLEGNSLPSENIQQLQDRIKFLEATIMQQNRLVAHKPQPEINFTELLDDMRFALDNQMRIMLQNFEATYRGVIDTQVVSFHKEITRQRRKQ